jgi:hypothetical protein
MITSLTEQIVGADHNPWLLARSLVLGGIGREAIFLIALPDEREAEPRGWAAWQTPKATRWIGPRHTNLFDGSVCAYANAMDNAWWPGDDLRTLLDIYSLWALWHLHLETFGRWAGRQYALLLPDGRPDPYYRLVEFNVDELCSCGIDGAKYGQCCRPTTSDTISDRSSRASSVGLGAER